MDWIESPLLCRLPLILTQMSCLGKSYGYYPLTQWFLVQNEAFQGHAEPAKGENSLTVPSLILLFFP